MSANRIALVDVKEEAASAFRSMLRILSGRARGDWQLVDSVNDANVLVTSFSGEGKALTPESNMHVVAIVESPEVRPTTPYVLTHPFRVMHVLSILEEIADQSNRAQDAVVAPAMPKWAFAISIRALERSQSRSSLYRAHTSDGDELLVRGDLESYVCSAPLLDGIREGSVGLTALVAFDAGSWPAEPEPRPFAELLWHYAYHASSRLAPWLDAHTTYRVRRWPDFGTIPTTRTHIQVVAALSRRALTPLELARAINVGQGEIEPVLNALSLCDLLVVANAPLSAQRGEVRGPPPSGFMRTLIDGLRAKFNMGR